MYTKEELDRLKADVAKIDKSLKIQLQGMLSDYRRQGLFILEISVNLFRFWNISEIFQLFQIFHLKYF